MKSRIENQKKYYLFLDEVQVIPEFERVINSLKVKFDISIFITGSNGKLLSGELATFLAGRYVSFSVYPFSFREVCEIKNISRENVNDELLQEYMVWGGLPQRFLLDNEEQTKTFLRDVYDTIVLKDIVQRAGVKDIELFGRIIEYLVCNPSQVFSPQSMSDYFLSINRKVSKETIYNYKKEYYQVAYYLYDEKVIEREFGAFNGVPDNYPKYVLSFDKMDFSRDGIIHRNIIDFLLD